MTGSVLLFAGIVLIAVVSPGPDFVIVLRNAVAGGSRSGIATAMGVAVGVSFWVVAAAAGATALVSASPIAFDVIRFAGAAYLAYLGARAIMQAWRERGTVNDPGADAPAQRHRTSFGQGLLCNVLNPKAAVFFLALMPQFVGADGDWADIGVLAASGGIVTAAWFLAVAMLVGRIRKLFQRRAVRAAVGTATGSVLIGLGAQVALST